MQTSVANWTSFAAGVAAVFVCGAAIDVYLLGHVEGIKGANTTFLMLLWFAPVLAFVTTLVFVLGARVWRFYPARLSSLLSGGAVAMLFFPLSWAGEYLPEPSYVVAITWLLILAGSFFAARIVRAWNRRLLEKSN